jgi:hypothetical protein
VPSQEAGLERDAGMSSEIVKNPGRSALLKLAKRDGSFRAVRDPATGDLYAWPASAASHAEMAAKLSLDFRT